MKTVVRLEAPEGWVPVQSPCQTNPDLWFSDNKEDKLEAKLTCMSCPLKVDCKRTAIDNREKFGVWGGTDFVTFKLPPKSDPTTCRKGLHKLPKDRENNQCPECRKITLKTWEAKQQRDNTLWYQKKLKYNKKGSSKHKNVVGGKCKDGHDLTEGNFFIRTNDNAVVCKKCIHKPKNPIGLGNLNSGSRNHG